MSERFSSQELERMLDKAESTGSPVSGYSEFALRTAVQKKAAAESSLNNPPVTSDPSSISLITPFENTPPPGVPDPVSRRTEVSPTYAGRYNFLRGHNKNTSRTGNKK